MKSRKPKWWQLYLLVPLMFVLFAAEHWIPLPGVSPDLADAGIVVFTFVAMLGWVHVNGGLLEWYEVDQDRSYYDLKITVYEPTSKSKGDGNGSDHSRSFAIPQSFAHVPDERSIKLKEEQKWFLN
jgi:hypothetical protein